MQMREMQRKCYRGKEMHNAQDGSSSGDPQMTSRHPSSLIWLSAPPHFYSHHRRQSTIGRQWSTTIVECPPLQCQLQSSLSPIWYMLIMKMYNAVWDFGKGERVWDWEWIGKGRRGTCLSREKRKRRKKKKKRKNKITKRGDTNTM